MPRVLTEDKALQISVTEIEKDTIYDLNSEFKAESDSGVYTYDSNNELIMWSDLCGKNSAGSTIDGISGGSYAVFAEDRSLNGNNNKFYSNPDLLGRRFDEASLTYVFSLLGEYLPNFVEGGLTEETLDMCGNPCSFFNISAAFQGTDECDMYAAGTDHFYVRHHADLTHTNENNTADQPFSISLWYYPVDYESNPNRLYNRGGADRLTAPTILHKTFEYALYIRECGKLEFVLYDIDIDAPYTMSSRVPVGTFTGTASTLTCRSNQNVLKPAQWNHITITYDGSGTRAGMKIYVNCKNETNSADVPGSRTGAKTYTPGVTLNTEAAWEEAYSNFLEAVYYTDDNEDPNAYTNMKTFSTPLVFASSAYPSIEDLLTTGGATNNLQVTENRMSIWFLSQLPLTFLFDFAMWQKELDEENIIAICNATRECAIKYSTRSIPYRDSGYINLSPKVLNKIRDEKRNELSVIDRIGDRSDRRVKVRPPFNDKNVLIFGEKINDEFKKGRFKFQSLNLARKDLRFGIPIGGLVPDENLWITTNALIKREEKNIAGEKVYDNALSLSAPGLSEIQTVKEFNNAIIYYDLILGPYNNKIGFLDLKGIPSGLSYAALTVQIQIQGQSSWKSIKRHIISPVDNSLERFYSPNYDSGIKLTPDQHQYRRSFSLHFSQIDSGGKPYKIKFTTTDSCWGIGKIEIYSANQSIRPPLLIDHDSYAGKQIDNLVIATPHTRSDLQTTGRSVSGISDSGLYFTDAETQKTLPFFDNTMLPFSGKPFFEEGVDPEIVDGYSSPLKDKTLFTIDLNLKSENGRELGFHRKMSARTSEEIAADQGSGTDFLNGDDIESNTFTTRQINSAAQFVNNSLYYSNGNEQFLEMAKFQGWYPATSNFYSGIVQNGIPFSPIDSVGSGSTGTGVPTSLKYHGKEVFESYAKPITSFGFPTSNTFYFEASQNYQKLIELSDYITKPFLLEKVVLEFDSTFDFAKSGQAHTGAVEAFKLRAGYFDTDGTTSAPGPKPSARVITNNIVVIPSYSLIKVSKSSGRIYTRNLKIRHENGNSINFSKTYSTTGNISGQNHSDYEGELITYGQITLYAAANSSVIDMKKVLDDGLMRDASININELPGQPANASSGFINPFTASFSIETPVRSMPIVSPTQRVLMQDIDTSVLSQTYGVFGLNPTGGRSVNQAIFEADDNKDRQVYSFSNSNRGLINNYASVDSKGFKNYKLNHVNIATDPEDVVTSGHLSEENKTTSPYLLFPEDKITLCFHYPIPQNGFGCIPGSTDTTFNKMKIGENIKIHLYGSAVKDSIEFHENMNQALTTAEISEPIGCEAVVDKFNIASKGEYHRSYLDKIPFKVVKFRNTGEVLPHPGNEELYVFENRDTGLGVNAVFGGIEPFLPKARIGLDVGSKVHHFKTYYIASASLGDSNHTHGFTGDYLDPTKQVLKGTHDAIKDLNHPDRKGSRHFYRKSFTAPFVELYNKQRRYEDQGNNSAGQLRKSRAREKYVFSHDHFGHYADIYDFAKDSSFSFFNKALDKRLITAREAAYYREMLGDVAIYNRSPVSIKFVTASLDSNNITNYYTTQDTTNFESFNKSLDASIDHDISQGKYIWFVDNR